MYTVCVDNIDHLNQNREAKQSAAFSGSLTGKVGGTLKK